ncbi:MAG: sigma-54 dependent transcriptional regulator [Planctomycetota bacterium]
MARTAFILILTDDQEQGQYLRESLRERHGHSCNMVSSLAEALDSIRRRTPDTVVVRMTAADAFTITPLIELLDGQAPDATLISIGPPGSPPDSSQVRLVILPAEVDSEELVRRVVEAANAAVARRDDRLLEQSLEEQSYEAFEGIIGTTSQMQRIIERIRKAARNKLTVLILGETGTGKDLIAEAIHRRSGRARKPLKSLNCAGINENLLESTLFGHVKGSFTGAVADRPGYFVAADGGTLFLDEIGDMQLNMQAKLLRVLEKREITPVGSTEVQRVDVRVISATNTDLLKAVEEKEFREDLYYRLKQWVIEVPSLRERRADIPLLVLHFLQQANQMHELDVPGVSSEALACLTKYFWPGNVRELANLIESLAVEVENRRIEAEDLPEALRGTLALVPVSGSGMVGLTMAQVERMMIERTLQATGGNREAAAKMLDIGTRTLYRKIKEYDLQ